MKGKELLFIENGDGKKLFLYSELINIDFKIYINNIYCRE
jgi:hypothetical protein